MPSRRSRRIRARAVVAAAVVLAVSATTACSSSSQAGGGTAKDVTLTVAVFNPFTGPDGAFGPDLMAGCLAGESVVNAAGGVLTDKVACLPVDTRGDPADAVTAAAKMLATTSHLFGVLGPSSDEADATAPLINAGKIPMFADTGEASFDQTKLQYFWRMTPADDVQGVAMAEYAKEKGYLRGAAVFGNDIGSQGSVPTLLKAYSALGGTMVSNEKITLGQSSYQPQVEQLIAAHPQVIFTEASPQANATFLDELQQLGHLIPVIGSDATEEQAWLTAVAGAIGKPALNKDYVGVQPYAPAVGLAWATYDKAMRAAPGVAKPTSQWDDDPFAMMDYDAVVVMALAADAAKSSNPVVWNSFIPEVTTAAPGAVPVNTYAAGLADLKAGKRIQYIGATGDIAWDKYHNSTGAFEVVSYGSGNLPYITDFSAATIASLLK